ncbi:hypothetical protein SIO70_00740 [Chitinophaga sancti]|uniref:hypothetical protein n=1 Tax=Chitinophaga sancti TaxID=1004 RepID=UPI002A750EB0|nr:hypothetical protein [Chitinophaga sancti]WPQ63388.1 hypothetical protein SIO70_00740 [Chitinophaga sancti]
MKARVIAMTMAAFTVLGALFAFKAYKEAYAGTLYCSYTTSLSCTAAQSGSITTSPYIGGYCTTGFGAPCTTMVYITA